MKYLSLVLALTAFSASAQTLYVPSGTSGIGNNTSNGNVGIGIATPSAGARLHVYNSSSNTFVNIDKPSSSYEGGIQFSKAGSVQFYLWNDNDSDALKIEAAGLAGENDATPRMEFPFSNKNIHMALSGGNVGIGTSAPASTLSVKGRLGIRADANPSSPGETMRIEGAITAEENVVNVTNLADQDFIVRLSGVGAGIKRTIIGPSVSNRFSLGVGINSGNEHLTIVSGGNVGIGTTSPGQKLDVRGNLLLETGSNPVLYTGTGTSELSRYLLLLNSPGFSSASGLMAGGVLVADSYTFATPGKNDLVVKGTVGIGTSFVGSYKLAVEGKIGAREVNVTSNAWSDYVFKSDYKLMPIADVEKFISENQHLPEVPSEKEVLAGGQNLGEMNAILLKKIEELTLYIINQQKQIDELKQKVGGK